VFVLWLLSIFLATLIGSEKDGDVDMGTVVGLSFLCALLAAPIVMVSVYYITQLFMSTIKSSFEEALEESKVEILRKQLLEE
jgi:hypothetical protein